LRIGRSNFCLLSDIKSKESTLKLIYDVLLICPIFKAFLVTVDVPEIYMQEFWATVTVHHLAIRFKMDNKKHILNLESFRDMLRIYPRVHGQTFDEPLFEEEILAFIHFLGHNAAIRTLTDEHFVYQVKHKNIKKSNEMYYPWDDHMFSTIKLVSRHQNTQLFGALLPIELTNEEIRSSNAYKEYYAIATGAAPPKPKASVRRKRNSSDTSITPPTAAASPRLTTSSKGKQMAKASKAKSLSALSEVAMTEAQQLKLVTKRSMQQMHISQASGSGTDEGTGSIPRVPDAPIDEDEESFDPIPQTPKNSKDEGNCEEDLGLNIGEEERHIEEEEEDELYRDVNINQGRGLQTSLEVEDSHFARAVSFIPEIVNRYMDQWMNEAVKVAVQIQSDRLRDETQRENDEFLRTVDENMKKIIKEQVKEQVKVQVSKILTRIKQAVNEQLEAEVLTRSSHSSRTSYAVAADLSEMELKKILIRKIEGNKSIQHSDEQRNLYKALVEAYESDKIILDTYGKTVTLKRCRDDDADKDKEPFAGPDRGSKRRREGKESESASAPTETATRSAGSIVIQRRVEDLQLGVESYQKKLNLPNPDSYRPNLKRKEAYTAYSNPRGFIYQNKDKRNRLMRIDEIHKFSDGMLIDVRTALDDRLKGIQIQYLPQSIWRKSDKDRAAAMIQAIDKRLKTRRIMRSLE
nr:hypothetical protein [Tanacetum cinerariifolium]